MEVVTSDDNYDEVKSLPQSGFVFPTIEPPSNLFTCYSSLLSYSLKYRPLLSFFTERLRTCPSKIRWGSEDREHEIQPWHLE
jgi:hypothetical protein